ncbi:D-alanyl-D-alanine carboxypeptidase family protein [Streptomyces sp. MUM 203J]|uniref:D-alanyl-D-alanine carboxypeptidase family protein n=1 Tax=Streptomyces sp. MUM 203J TaxID=2791990 RepID=UPI001F03C1A7|nr:serine hydrolase [Streptomyces sp. MUM 203J]
MFRAPTPEAEEAPAARRKAAPKWADADADADAAPGRDAAGTADRADTGRAGERPGSTFVPLRAGAGPEADAPAPAALTEAERTKQQPLPPRPPLDMLAELTNTPPPPPTLLRTTARRLKIWTPLVVLLLIVFATVQMLRPLPEPSLRLSAGSSYTFEGGRLDMPWPGEGQGAVAVEGVGTIGTYGPQKPAPTASVAKTMTAYVLLKDRPIKDKDGGPVIEIDQLTEDQSHNADWSVAPVKKGQKYTQGELMQLLMVVSANNVAHLLARWDAGTEEAFLRKMNAAAGELGMKDTVYTDPSGFEKTTVSTPTDQLKLARAVMEFDAFREIVDMPSVDLPQIGKELYNGNSILLKDGVAGIKTGTSTPAGGNLLWAAYTLVDGKRQRILGVTMGVKSPVHLSEKTKLAIETYSYNMIRTAQDGVDSQTAVRKGDVVGYVDDGLGGRTPVVATEDLKPVGWAGLNVELTLTEGGKDLPRNAVDGTVVGELSVGKGEGRVSVPVALQEDLSEPGIGIRLTRLG